MRLCDAVLEKKLIRDQEVATETKRREASELKIQREFIQMVSDKWEKIFGYPFPDGKVEIGLSDPEQDTATFGFKGNYHRPQASFEVEGVKFRAQKKHTQFVDMMPKWTEIVMAVYVEVAEEWKQFYGAYELAEWGVC